MSADWRRESKQLWEDRLDQARIRLRMIEEDAAKTEERRQRALNDIARCQNGLRECRNDG